MSQRIAYLACSTTLPGAPDRRVDAFEHDQTMVELTPAFAARGLVLEAIAWDDPRVLGEPWDAAIIGTTWDYWDRAREFLATLRRFEASAPLFNPAALVAWNGHKRYLEELAGRGVPTIPTVWLDVPTEAAVGAAFDALGSDDLVVKRQVGAGASGQHRLRRGAAVPPMPHAMLAQPFLPTIEREGELSFVFVDGHFSHALRKSAAAGDYRVQTAYGGVEEPIAPTDADLAGASRVLEALDEPPLYARVDVVRGGDGALLLMELELIEPFLYPLQGPGLGERLAAGIRRRLESGRTTGRAPERAR